MKSGDIKGTYIILLKMLLIVILSILSQQKGLFEQEPSYIENFFFGANQDHIFSYTFEYPVADYMEEFISSLHIRPCGYIPNFCCELSLCIIYFCSG